MAKNLQEKFAQAKKDGKCKVNSNEQGQFILPAAGAIDDLCLCLCGNFTLYSSGNG